MSLFLRRRNDEDEGFECPVPITCQFPRCDCGEENPMDAVIKIHDALTAAGLEYSALSWGGFNLFGDEKSIEEAKRLLHNSDSRMPALEIELRQTRSLLSPEGARTAECHCGNDGHALNSINCPVHGGAKSMDPETIQTLLDLLNPLHGSLDRQTYDEKDKQNFDAPADAEYAVNVTAQQERDLTQAVLILEDRKRQADALSPPMRVEEPK